MGSADDEHTSPNESEENTFTQRALHYFTERFAHCLNGQLIPPWRTGGEIEDHYNDPTPSEQRFEGTDLTTAFFHPLATRFDLSPRRIRDTRQ